ncbi:ABC transporter permease [Pseudomonas sp. Marseille-QA0332]
MLVFMLRRLFTALSVALTVSMVSFILLNLSGDLATAIAGPDATAEQVEQIRIDYKLDQPLPNQYLNWLGKALTLDFGHSFFVPEPVSELISRHLPITLGLGVSALLLAVLVAIPLGVLSAFFRDSWIDRFAQSLAVLAQAMPTFFTGLLFIVVFAVTLHWFPVAGNTTWKHFVLPSAALALHAVPAMLRLTRSGMLDVLGMDYIRTAYAKGLGHTTVVCKHALRNAVIPVIALVAVELGFMLGGSIVIESVFSLQGLGSLIWVSISRNDFPVVQAVVLIIALFYIGLTFFADVLNAYLDPRMRVRQG